MTPPIRDAARAPTRAALAFVLLGAAPALSLGACTGATQLVAAPRPAGSIALVTFQVSPEGAFVTLDDQRPVRLEPATRVQHVTPGQHRVLVSAPGFVDARLVIDAESGERYTVVVDLWPSLDAVDP